MAALAQVLRGLIAVTLIVVGVWFWSPPAALVVAGVLLLLDRVTDRSAPPPTG